MGRCHPRNQLSWLGRIVLALMAVFAAVLYGLWSPLQPIAPPVTSVEPTVQSASGPAGAEALEPVDTRGSANATAAPIVDERTRVSASEAVSESSGETEVSLAAADPAVVKVEISVVGDVWLSDRVSDLEGSLSWRASPLPLATRPVTMTSRTRGTVELDGVPESHTEFQDIHLAGMVFRPTGLNPVPEGRSDCAAVLEVEPVLGATLVWSAATPAGERLPVEIALLGSNSPVVEQEQWWGMEGGRAPRQAGCELPYALPRLVKAESVWVGREGRTWRAFPVALDDVEVIVQLAEAGSLRVLHDGPRTATHGTEQPTAPLYAVLESFPSGSLRVQRVMDEEPLLFDELSMGECRVWLALGKDREARRISHEQRFFIESSETVEADLTRSFAAEHLGGVRLYVTGSDAAMEVAEVELEIDVMRRAEEGNRWPWISEGKMRALDASRSDARPFLIGGLLPGEHVLVVRPMGTKINCSVRAGEETHLDLRLADPGWMKLQLPEHYDADMCIVLLTIVESGAEDHPIHHSREVAEQFGGRYPLTPGTYRAEIYPLGSKGLPMLACPDFFVRSGEECVVAAEPLPRLRVKVEVRNMEGGGLVALPYDFWVNVAVLSVATGDQILGVTSFQGGTAACTGIDVTFSVKPEMARFRAPESLFWSFAPVEPVELRDGMTVVLHATAR